MSATLFDTLTPRGRAVKRRERPQPTTEQTALTLEPLTFGSPAWIVRRGPEQIDPKRIARLARVAVERTPLFRVAGEVEPVDPDEYVRDECPKWIDDEDDRPCTEVQLRHEVAAEFAIVDHDPAKYFPYSDLVEDGGEYFLVGIV